MRRLFLSNLTVDGFVAGPQGEFDWHTVDVVCPIMLGEGKPLHPGLGQRMPLTLIDSTTFASGAVCHCYRPADAPAHPG